MKQYFYEFFFTFFQFAILTTIDKDPGILGLTHIMTLIIVFQIYPEYFPNIAVIILFLVTGYKPIIKIRFVVLAKIFGALLAMVFNFGIGSSQSKFFSDGLTFGHIFFYELLFKLLHFDGLLFFIC